MIMQNSAFLFTERLSTTISELVEQAKWPAEYKRCIMGKVTQSIIKNRVVNQPK